MVSVVETASDLNDAVSDLVDKIKTHGDSWRKTDHRQELIEQIGHIFNVSRLIDFTLIFFYKLIPLCCFLAPF